MSREGGMQEAVRDVVNMTDHFIAEIVDVKPVWYKGKWIANQATPGFADVVILCELDCRVILLEIKTKNGRQNENQKRFQARWEKHGGIYRIAREPNHLRAALEACAEHCRIYGHRDVSLTRLIRANLI